VISATRTEDRECSPPVARASHLTRPGATLRPKSKPTDRPPATTRGQLPTTSPGPATSHSIEREGRQSLTTQRFHVLLTLFSKFFSSFAHATCALSVLWQYLALPQVYAAVRAAIPNSPTRGRDQRSDPPGKLCNGAVTLLGVSFQRDFPAPEKTCRPTHTPQRDGRLQAGEEQ